MTRTVLAVFYCAMMFLAANSQAQAPYCGPGAEHEKLATLFPQSYVKECLFVVNADYALQAIYHRAGELSELNVAPKWFFRKTHPEWSEPESPVAMSLDDYKSLLDRIQMVKPLGKLLKESKFGFRLNSRIWSEELYERGVLEKAMCSAPL